MLVVKNLRVRTYDVRYHDIYWDIEDTSEDVTSYQFEVLRSEGPEGPYLSIAPPFTDQYSYRDIDAHAGHPKRRFYYKIRVTNTTSGDMTSYPDRGEYLHAEVDKIALEKSRLRRLHLKLHSGRRVWILPRRRSGQLCSCYDRDRERKIKSNCLTCWRSGQLCSCYDRDRERKIKSNCRTCYDTKYVGGFLSPIETYMSIREGAEFSQQSPQVEIVQTNAQAVLPHYPPVVTGDIIVETENVRWKVLPVDGFERRRFRYEQRFQLGKITPGDIIYKVPLGVDWSTLGSPDQYRRIKRAT
jgi:hypothetical protein